MNEKNQWDVILKRNKFWTFMNLLFFVIIFLFMVLIVRWWDYEVFLPPYENIDAMLGISFSFVVLTIWIVIFFLQLIKKWELVANESWIIDNYSALSKWEIYPRSDIVAINYMWRGTLSSKGLQKKLVIMLSTWKKSKTFILPTLTDMSFSLWDIKRSILRYNKYNWNNIIINDFTKYRWINGIIIRNLWW